MPLIQNGWRPIEDGRIVGGSQVRPADYERQTWIRWLPNMQDDLRIPGEVDDTVTDTLEANRVVQVLRSRPVVQPTPEQTAAEQAAQAEARMAPFRGVSLAEMNAALGGAEKACPMVHTHTIAEVQGLQTALNAIRPGVWTTPFGYATGAGGTVVQATNKSTAVTLHKLCGTITMHGASLAAGATVSFTVNNNQMVQGDVVHIQHDTVGAIGVYNVVPNTSANGSFRVSVRNNSAGSLAEAIVLRFVIIKAVVA